MIVLDTTVLVYAVGADHELRRPAQRLVEAIAGGGLRATTTVETIQELVHVRARRRDRSDAAAVGRAFATLLSPLLRPTEDDLTVGLRLFEQHRSLGAFDAVLAAASVNAGADALVSADRSFGVLPQLPWLDLAGGGVDELLSL